MKFDNTSSDAADYTVGYAKPPAETRFKKGRSGNPTGRPKGITNLTTALQKAMREMVAITENGHSKRISKLDAAAKQIVNKAAGGDLKAIQLMARLAVIFNGNDGTDAPNMANSKINQQVIKQFVTRIKDATNINPSNDQEKTK